MHRNKEFEMDLVEFFSDIDSSVVQYNLNTKQFEIFFDKNLYIPPKMILETE